MNIIDAVGSGLPFRRIKSNEWVVQLRPGSLVLVHESARGIFRPSISDIMATDWIVDTSRPLDSRNEHGTLLER